MVDLRHPPISTVGDFLYNAVPFFPRLADIRRAKRLPTFDTGEFVTDIPSTAPLVKVVIRVGCL